MNLVARFAVADDGLGEFEREAAQQFFELGVTRVGDVVDFALAVFAGGDDDEAVVGAGVAVNGDGVEAFRRRFPASSVGGRVGKLWHRWR